VCDSVAAIVPKSLFDQIFPLNVRNAFYTYDGFVQAATSYPQFATTGTCDQRKRDIAAFFANVSRETARLKYVEQIAKADYCDKTFTMGPCEPGKQYYGRGPIQISWNYNYYSAGTCLGLGTQLLKNPDVVAQDPKIAWMTGLWFWNTGGAGSCTNERASCALPPDTTSCDSPHKAITSDKGFGATIDIVNGVEECHGGTQSYARQAVTERVCYYQKYVQILGTTVGPGDLNCGTTVGTCPSL
jgi:predicted chitinase